VTDQIAAELSWRKSSHSGNEGGECLEMAPTPAVVHVRDSKDTVRPGLALGPAAWTAFLGFAAGAESPGA
jgi:hypothetical protein